MTKKWLSDKRIRHKHTKILNEEPTGNLPEKVFKVMIVQMNLDIRKRMETQIKKLQETFNKDLEDINNKQTQMNSLIPEMKNTLHRMNASAVEAEE